MSHQSDWIYYKQPIKFLLVSTGNVTLLFFHKGVNSISADKSSPFVPTRCLLFSVTNGNLTLVFCMGVPYLFAHKPTSAISRDPKLFYISSC